MCKNPLLLIDSGVQAITIGQTSLEYIALRKLKMLSNVGLERIRSAFLREIDLRWNEDIEDVAVENLVSNNLNLRIIHLIHCHLLTDKSISVIAQHLAEKLVCFISFTQFFTDPSFIYLFFLRNY